MLSLSCVCARAPVVPFDRCNRLLVQADKRLRLTA